MREKWWWSDVRGPEESNLEKHNAHVPAGSDFTASGVNLTDSTYWQIEDRWEKGTADANYTSEFSKNLRFISIIEVQPDALLSHLSFFLCGHPTCRFIAWGWRQLNLLIGCLLYPPLPRASKTRIVQGISLSRRRSCSLSLSQHYNFDQP